MKSRAAYLAMRAYTRSRIARGRLLRRGGAWRGLRILGYHRIAPERHVLNVPLDAFRRQMEAVLESGATPVRLDRAYDLLDVPIEARHVAVTFDDGYLDNLAAVDVLRELGIPATIYLPTRILDGEASYWWFDDPPPALSWSDVAALRAEDLVDVQAHTRTHPWLPRVDDARARDEIEGSRDDLAARLGEPPTSFCYPAGLYGPREVALVRAAGYRAAVTTDPGVNPGGGDPHTLKRTLVYWEDGERDFRAKLDGLLDRPPALRALIYRRRASG